MADSCKSNDSNAMSFHPIFTRLREILEPHAATLSVLEDSAECYSLGGAPGPAAVRAWGGKLKKQTMPVAWVQVGKAYVSYHLMPIYGNAKLRDSLSEELKARMQGKSCFNFKTQEEALFKELEQVTLNGITAFRKAGFIPDKSS